MLNKILVGRYRLLKLLSSGTSTETYLAEDIHLPDRPQCINTSEVIDDLNHLLQIGITTSTLGSPGGYG